MVNSRSNTLLDLVIPSPHTSFKFDSTMWCLSTLCDTLLLMSTAAPYFTNSWTTSTSPLRAARWIAVSPLCNIMHRVTIVRTVVVVEFHLISDVAEEVGHDFRGMHI